MQPMTVSRRSAIAAAGAALALPQAAGMANAADRLDAAELYSVSGEANAALMRGDIARYTDLVSLSDDFTLMSPFGGVPTRGVDYTPERMEAMGRFFRNGSFRQELVQAYQTDDMVVLAVIEHANVEVGGLPAQNWSLRVTLVYRRQGADWRLVHRHADPIAPGISLETAAALARGDAQPA
jgi:ketosteroid isomerase-like protein